MARTDPPSSDVEPDVEYVAVLHDVTLDVQQGEIVCVIGANGAGKTTLLKTIAGVLRPAGGANRGRR